MTFRHDIPLHLAGVHRTLLQYGHDMGKKHGKGFKRNIRFDDTALSFCIDVCLPGNDNKWLTVSYDRAYKDRQLIQIQENRKHGNELSSQGEPMSAAMEISENRDNEDGSSSRDQSKWQTGASGSAGFTFEGRSGPSNEATWGSNK